MNLELFIAKRIHFSKKGHKTVSRPAVRVATLGIALGLAVMIITVSIVLGFKQEIRNKVIAFGSHIQVTNFDSNETFETAPIYASDSLVKSLSKIEGISHIQRYATKPGIIKTDKDVQGVVLKGVGADFDWNFYAKNLVQGSTISLNDSIASKEAIISSYLARLLHLKVDSSFFTYFIEDDYIRARKFKVVGIYCTNFVEYDKLFILTDIKQIQQLNNWNNTQASGLEILINDYNRLDELGDKIYFRIANRLNPDGSTYFSRTIEDLNPQIFSWLDMLDLNVIIILVLMLTVAGFNMISGLLILILERTNMIGVLKAMGAKNWSIRKVFLYHSFFLIGKGMLWGNVLGVGLILIQYYTHLIPLNPETYYVTFVPVTINLVYILLLNIGTFICSVLMLLLPSYLISRILPAKSIRFE
ncbi:MAG: ABC transporter permease [Paludibacteraceae bacterium]|nr:ABC transporter permease [Paludibacteraceae bacterium]